MKKKEKDDKIHLTDHFTYQIIDNVIYLFQSGDCSSDELKVIFKKVSLIIEDEDIDYINVSSKNIEKKKDFYSDMGFVLSYYSVDKLNKLYKGYKDKKEYRCYAMMTKKDFLNINNKDKKEKSTITKKKSNSDQGFISSMFLLFFGIAFFCYLCIRGAAMLIGVGR